MEKGKNPYDPTSSRLPSTGSTDSSPASSTGEGSRQQPLTQRRASLFSSEYSSVSSGTELSPIPSPSVCENAPAIGPAPDLMLGNIDEASQHVSQSPSMDAQPQRMTLYPRSLPEIGPFCYIQIGMSDALQVGRKKKHLHPSQRNLSQETSIYFDIQLNGTLMFQVQLLFSHGQKTIMSLSGGKHGKVDHKSA
ncbi:hypothetical protein KC19_VG269100 [Ceratodon purpureus]|uniref:Uncharacterized protein n=1 Tax=Ceratodon purpureus TaxID=3225 RepID=A0A8T0HU19_CERPU|nr:hypothetical protein KC19_VG269100 [Ceratodon purpureus]